MFEKIIEKIKMANTVGIFTHINPDGDALGSSYSLKSVLKAMGKRAEVYLCGSAEPCVCDIVSASFEPEFSAEECDMLIALDCADIERLGIFKDTFASHNNTAAIDHHVTHRHFAGETIVGDISSTCELIYGMYKEMGVTLGIDAATDLYTGIATDTGNFKYSSVTGETHRVAAELIEMNVPFAEISKRVFDTKTRQYLALKSRAIAALEFYCDNKVAVLKLDNSDFEECGIGEAEASGIVTLPCQIEGVEVGIYIRQRGDEGLKISLRSARYVDVAEVAGIFGGGGHIRAAGYSVEESKRNENLKKLIAEIEKRL